MMDHPTQKKPNGTPSFPLFQTEESRYSDPNQNILLEPVYPEFYNLIYTCLLIPRFPFHQLKGDLANLLPQWLQQICASCSWKLEFITVHLDYFQWAISIAASFPPGYFMQQIRYSTSKMILSNFMHLKSENLSDDFWAPGYLVVLGTRPHPEEMIWQYIRLARRQQCLDKLEI